MGDSRRNKAARDAKGTVSLLKWQQKCQELFDVTAERDRLRTAIRTARDDLWNRSNCTGCMERICECWVYRIRAVLDAALETSTEGSDG